jgi:ABC-type nitrate/sulfonate/bicarbonate transport system substrate-binding protein
MKEYIRILSLKPPSSHPKIFTTDYDYSLILLTCVFLFSFLYVGCTSESSTRPSSSTQEGDQVITVRLGYRPAALSDITPVIIKEGDYGVEGLQVELVSVSSPSQAFASFRAEEIDAIAGMPLAAVFSQISPDAVSNRPFQAYYLQVDKKGEGWVSLVSNGNMQILSVDDLRGKTVMSLPTNQAKYLLRRILLEAGLQESEIDISQYNPANPLLPLRSGQGAAIFGLEPAISKAAAEGHKVLVRGPVSQYLFGGRPVPVSASLIASSFVRDHPEAYRSFVEVINKAVSFAESKPDSVRRYFQKPDYGGLEESTAMRLFMPVMTLPDSSLKETTLDFIEDLRSEGFLEQPSDNYLSPLFPSQAVGTPASTAPAQ